MEHRVAAFSPQVQAPHIGVGADSGKDLLIVSRVSNDGARYFGPYGMRQETRSALDAVRAALHLPTCHKTFPRDIGKERPCLNHHMGRCDGLRILYRGICCLIKAFSSTNASNSLPTMMVSKVSTSPTMVWVFKLWPRGLRAGPADFRDGLPAGRV